MSLSKGIGRQVLFVEDLVFYEKIGERIVLRPDLVSYSTEVVICLLCLCQHCLRHCLVFYKIYRDDG